MSRKFMVHLRFSIVAAVLFFLARPSFAAELTNIVETPPEWLTYLLHAAETIPMIGNIVAPTLAIVGVIAAISTGLSVLFTSLMSIPEVAQRFAGQKAKADKIKAFADKVNYWLKYFSIFNAQTKK